MADARIDLRTPSSGSEDRAKPPAHTTRQPALVPYLGESTFSALGWTKPCLLPTGEIFVWYELRNTKSPQLVFWAQLDEGDNQEVRFRWPTLR